MLDKGSTELVRYLLRRSSAQSRSYEIEVWGVFLSARRYDTYYERHSLGCAGPRFAVGGISEALRQELLEDAIRITQWSSLSSLRTETPTRVRG